MELRLLQRCGYVPQRDIDNFNQRWENQEDRKIGKAINQGYEIKDTYYNWKKDQITNQTIPDIKYKDILFNVETYYGLATNTINVFAGGSKMSSTMARVNSYSFGSQGAVFLDSNDSTLSEGWALDPIRVVTFLKPNIKYLSAGDNEWDIYQFSSEDKELKLKVLNLSSEPANNIGLEVSKRNTTSIPYNDTIGRLIEKRFVNGKTEYMVNVKQFYGQRREGTGDHATFIKADNMYNIAVTGIPAGYDFKIIGKLVKQIDLDRDKNLEYEIVIYPKPGTQNIPVEYVGGEYDYNFSVTGSVVIKSGYEELGRSNLTLKRGMDLAQIPNVDLFNSYTNSIKPYTVEFTKSYDDNSLHTVRYDSTNKKLIVTYVPKNKNITVSVDQDSKKYLSNISEIRLRLVGGTNRSVTLRPSSFSSSVSVQERDSSGRLITYRLEKVADVPGYYMNINGYNVSLKPIIKLPYTGTELSKKNIAIISLGLFGIAIVFRFRKRIVFIFKEYTMMK